MGRDPQAPTKAVAGMATMATRAHTFPQAFASIIDQVDRLYLYLDRMDEVPETARANDRVVPVFSSDEPGLGCDGKFLPLVREEEPFLFVGIDDDIVYPPDYVAHLRAELGAVGRPAIVGMHGVRLKQPHASYRRDRIVFHWAKACTEREPVHVLGTGTLAFEADDLRFDPRDWAETNVTDLQVAREAAKRGVPLYCAAREQDYLHALEEEQPDSLYLELTRDDRVHTRLALEVLALGDRRAPATAQGS